MATTEGPFYMCVEELYERQKVTDPPFEDPTDVDDWDNNHNWSRARKFENTIRLARYEAGFGHGWNPEQAEARHDLLRSIFPGNATQTPVSVNLKKLKAICP